MTYVVWLIYARSKVGRVARRESGGTGGEEEEVTLEDRVNKVYGQTVMKAM